GTLENMTESDRAAEVIASLTLKDVQDPHSALIQLVDWHVPQGFYGGEPLWDMIALGLVVRTRDIVDSISTLASTQRESECLALVRVLYEHVVTFCWLAIDPEDHVP